MIGELQLKDLGPIKSACVKFKNLTIICGRNGVGKTYLSYTYYMLMQSLRRNIYKAISIPNELNAYVLKSFSEGLTARKTFKFEISDFNLGVGSLEGCLKLAGNDRDILKSLDINDLGNKTKVNGFLEKTVYDRIHESSENIEFKSSVSIELYKKSKSDTIKIIIEKIGDESLDLSNVMTDFSFIIKIFFLDHVLKLNQFSITSERTGVVLFNSDLSGISHRYETDENNKSKIVNYSKPIRDNIIEVARIKQLRLLNGWFKHTDSVQEPKIKDLVGGDYIVDDGQIYFKPKGRDVQVPIRSSSGASKSLLLLDYFLHNIHRYSVLIIDEPELNLHLDNQKEVARILCYIANQGVQVVVTTHSDHFIREINNLIMLSNPKIKEEHRLDIMERTGVLSSSLMNPNDISTVVISSEKRKTFAMPISEYGIDLKLFNDEIMDNNSISNEIMSAIYGDC